MVLRKKWLDSLGLGTISNWQRVCSKHFELHCFKNINGHKRKLWPNAIPSLCTFQFEVVNKFPETINQDGNNGSQTQR